MTVARTLGLSLRGLSGTLVEVEAEASRGLPAFTIVGLPDSSTLQARERVRGACAHSGLPVSDKKLTVNLTPAWIPKRGSGFDLAIAMSVLASLKSVDPEALVGVLFMGELTLDGEVRPVPGVLPALREAALQGVRTAVVAAANSDEAKLVPGITSIAVEHLTEAIAYFGGSATATARVPSFAATYRRMDPGSGAEGEPGGESLDFSDVGGQEQARLAAEVAASGGHHLLMVGPPGAGKTMIASRIPSILPPLEGTVALELSAVASVSGTFDARLGLVQDPPFEAPHHTASTASVIGGGSGIAMPGAISRAHGGVLFLDEAPEFSPRVLDALREPLESGDIVLDRAGGSVRYPARFQLILAANPCPCGRASGRGDTCSCSSLQKRRYLTRLSGPIVDRVDLRLTLPPVRLGTGVGAGEPSASIRARVCAARERQADRLAGTPWHLNAHVSGRYLNSVMMLEASDDALLIRAVEKGRLTMRGRDRVRRLAWTLADLRAHERPRSGDVADAIALRGRDAA